MLTHPDEVAERAPVEPPHTSGPGSYQRVPDLEPSLVPTETPLPPSPKPPIPGPDPAPPPDPRPPEEPDPIPPPII